MTPIHKRRFHLENFFYLVAIFSYIWTHPANERHRLAAVWRACKFQYRGRVLHRPSLARLGGRTKVWAILHRPASSKVVYANLPDFVEMTAWRRAIKSGDLFIDVGANIGAYALLAAELGANAIALEPAPDTFALLMRNIELNNYSVEAIRAAAGTDNGMATYTSGKDCANRFDPCGDTVVPTVDLDSIIGDRVVDGLKIDVEGYEYDVLRGCRRALHEHRIMLMQLEWNSTSETAMSGDRSAIAELLSSYGYQLCRPDAHGNLVPIADTSFGPDVFARPTT